MLDASWCLDNPQDLLISGNYDSGTVNALLIHLTKQNCTNDCDKLDESIDDMSLEVYVNTLEYNPDEYNGEYITKNIKKEVFNFDTRHPQVALYEIHKNLVIHEDYYFNLGFSEKEDEFYETKLYRTQNGFTAGD